jgi:hypothetical protein
VVTTSTPNRSPWPVVLIAGVVVLLLSVGAFAVGGIALAGLKLLNPPATAMHAVDRSAPLGDLKSATLELSYSSTQLTLSSADLGGELYTAHFDLPQSLDPSTRLDPNGALSIAVPPQHRYCFFNCSETPSRLRLTLNDRVPWTLSLDGGAAHGALDLSGLSLAGLDVSGGAISGTIELPKPKGTVAVTVSGGADSLTFSAPTGTEMRLRASGGASSLLVNGSASHGLGQSVERESAGYPTATDRYDVTVSGGANRVSWES